MTSYKKVNQVTQNEGIDVSDITWKPWSTEVWKNNEKYIVALGASFLGFYV